MLDWLDRLLKELDLPALQIGSSPVPIRSYSAKYAFEGDFSVLSRAVACSGQYQTRETFYTLQGRG